MAVVCHISLLVAARGCENWCAKTGVRKLVCDRTFHPLCFESEMNTRKGWGIT
ncbi:hypothetical protein [Microcoleus sp. T2B6]|uniref:hypothetical protein n=1 Tax=Microcoleus sp. T2B6 TaxID=3055424 RepID=UPI002FD2AD11